MATLTAAPPSDEPFTIAHTQELARANDRVKTIRRAARVAGFNGWVTALIAICSAPFAYFSLVALIATVALAVVAWNEFRGRRRLLAFDPSATAILGWNQVGLLALVVVYCLWMIYTSLSGGDPLAELKANPEMNELLGAGGAGFEVLYRQFVIGFYGLVILLTVIFQGGNAYYYFTRRRHIESYVRETPAWVRDLQRASLLS
jgi:hypothetical protein